MDAAFGGTVAGIGVVVFHSVNFHPGSAFGTGRKNNLVSIFYGKNSRSTVDDVWNQKHENQTGNDSNRIKLGIDDVEQNSQFSCSVEFDETKLTTTT